MLMWNDGCCVSLLANRVTENNDNNKKEGEEEEEAEM